MKNGKNEIIIDCIKLKKNEIPYAYAAMYGEEEEQAAATKWLAENVPESRGTWLYTLKDNEVIPLVKDDKPPQSK